VIFGDLTLKTCPFGRLRANSARPKKFFDMAKYDPVAATLFSLVSGNEHIIPAWIAKQ